MDLLEINQQSLFRWIKLQKIAKRHSLSLDYDRCDFSSSASATGPLKLCSFGSFGRCDIYSSSACLTSYNRSRQTSAWKFASLDSYGIKTHTNVYQTQSQHSTTSSRTHEHSKAAAAHCIVLVLPVGSTCANKNAQTVSSRQRVITTLPFTQCCRDTYQHVSYRCRRQSKQMRFTRSNNIESEAVMVCLVIKQRPVI